MKNQSTKERREMFYKSMYMKWKSMEFVLNHNICP